MFAALISDRFGADSVMLTALTLFLAAQIITVAEGLEGFSNEGLWAVMVLFVVAEGIGKTGALDWYMSKLLGHPTSLASAQLRLMVPIALVSAFLNNTPVVVVMIPITLRWAKNIRLSAQQLLIPLSFASILGGTCTLIGTSTNLVVTGLLEDRYTGTDSVSIGLFDLGLYGVPIAMAGIAYTLLASPYFLPGGKGNVDAAAEADELLVGARLTQWSPAVNRTVQRSGLRDTGGIYLVSVHRAATGNVHRAVSKDFVLNVGDILYFTGHNVEHFGEFCAENGLEVVTNEISTQHNHHLLPQSPTLAITENRHDDAAPLSTIALVNNHDHNNNNNETATGELPNESLEDDWDPTISTSSLKIRQWQSQPSLELETIMEDNNIDNDDDKKIADTVGCTKESLLAADYDELIRNINRMRDIIRNANTSSSQRSIIAPDAPTTATASGTTLVGPGGRGGATAAGSAGNHAHHYQQIPIKRGSVASPRSPTPQQVNTVDGLRPNDPPKIVVTIEKDLVVVGINARDRAGLLLDISKGLLRLDLQLHHTEAAVFIERSVSIWRCQVIGTELPDVEQIWSVLNALLSTDSGVEAIKKRGLRVIRAVVIKGSRLIGKTATEVNFRNIYKTAIVALRQGGHNVPTANLSTVRFDVGDILILQASDDSPLLKRPPPNFYKELEEALAAEQHHHHHHHHLHHGGGGSTSSGLTKGTSMQSLVNLIRRRSSGNLSAGHPTTSDDDDDEELGSAFRSNKIAATGGPGDAETGVATHGTPSVLPPREGVDTAGDMFFLGEDGKPLSLENADRKKEEEEAKQEEGGGNGDTNMIVSSVGDSAAVAGAPSRASEESLDDAALHRQTQLEKVWKDMMVLFKSKSSDDPGGEGSGGGGVGTREFLTAMAVAHGSKFAGKTVAQAGIHKLPDLFLVSIERPRELFEQDVHDNDNDNPNALNPDHHQNRRISKFAPSLLTRFNPHQRQEQQQFPPQEDEAALAAIEGQSVRTDQVAYEAIDPDEPLKEGDVLWFSGSASAVGDLRKIPGLVQFQSEEVEKINERVHDRRLVQAVVARNGPLVGHSIKELQFRTRYGAAVIAVHREGKRVHEHPGRVKLQAGDVLLLEAGPSFLGRSVENDRAFALLAEVKDSAPPRLDLLIPALAIAVAMLAVFTAGVTSILICALVAAVLMVALGILSEQEARDAFKWDIYITIACAFGIGNAMVNSGVAGGIANFLVNVGNAVGMGDAGLLGAVYFATFLISNVVTNNAAAALLFPIAMDAADQTGVDRVIMSFCIMLGASASFMSPFGYTTNLLIYGPGGYKYNDFLRFGTPMQLVLWVLSTAFLVIEQWYLSWVAMFFVLVFVSFWRIATRKSGTKATTSSSSSSNGSIKNTPGNTAVTTASSFATTVHVPSISPQPQDPPMPTTPPKY
ncbi:hypothetical protein ACA910_018036 [Epithemia clementina (nom. ined.)]